MTSGGPNLANVGAGVAMGAGIAHGISLAIKGPDTDRETAQQREALKKQISAATESIHNLGNPIAVNYDGASLEALRTAARDLELEAQRLRQASGEHKKPAA